MRIVLGIIVSVVLIGVGVAGTLGAQALGRNESEACTITRGWADSLVKFTKDEPGLSREEWNRRVGELNGVYDLAFKACNP